MISAVAEQYEIHPQTLRLYEREGLLKPSRSEGNTRLYTPEDLERLKAELAARLTPLTPERYQEILEADRRGAPSAVRAEQRLLPPLELGGGDGAGGSHGLEQDTAGEDPMFVHRVPPIDSSVRDWG